MKKIVVIGNGMVGFKFCQKLREKAGPSDFDITIIGEENFPAYDRVHLSEYFTDGSVDSLLMAPLQWYDDNNVKVLTGELVVEIDRDKKEVTTFKGTNIAYDILIMATGSKPFVPNINGIDKSGVFVYRTIEDLESIIGYAKASKSAAIIGGGLLGLEAAKATLDMGLTTHVIEFASRLMPRQLDSAGAQILGDKLEDLNLKIHLKKQTTAIIGKECIEALQFSEGQDLPVEMLIISAGIRPRDELAKKCGLEVGNRGGIVVNGKMQSSDPAIYAIGEVALHNEMIYGLVGPGYEMANVVVSQLLDEEATIFNACDTSTKLKLIGVDVASFGDALLDKAACDAIVFEDSNARIYKRINISKDGKYLLGGILVGDADDYNKLLQVYKSKMILPPNPEDLMLGSRNGENEGNGIEQLDDSAQICSCESVTKGEICQAVKEQDISDLGVLKKCTKAGTGCGACTPMVKDLMNLTLTSMGKEVKKVICEHFDFSRQELLDIIRVKEIKTFNALIDQVGTGDGCEICKPVVASLLASAWNDLISNQSTIQDTNDRYLANIQKGGSYSVVPRVPGGEITPDKLIILGTLAKKYGLYTKITGGQRIDMFGARIDQLPDIWEELVDAGFESGHAYGKALRTVKSCVGSAWCRFGLHDSVSFAIKIEERYRGLRAPHKLKSAVSGCRRECAEAQSKDFGIIATEVGWNLYVCGNGGANPRHADLLASDISDEECIKYIDRFLMFYIKTAEHLNRTSTWLNKMEGGIDYLKEVVVHDVLGIGAQLEAEMQLLIEAYKCEWKEVVENPALRARFKHFVNADNVDPTLKFEKRREQIVPTDWSK